MQKRDGGDASMMASDNSEVDSVLANLTLEHQTSSSSSSTTITLFPTDIQKLILQHLDGSELLRLRATNIYYRDIITNDIQDIWKIREDERWSNSKRKIVPTTHNRYSLNINDWSRANGWMLHPTDIINNNWYQEFMRRCKLDSGIYGQMCRLEIQRGLGRSTNDTWYSLMSDGQDIIDGIKRIIRRKYSNSTSSTNYDKDCICIKILNGISRCIVYRQWKYLHDPAILPHTNVEDGAIVIAKFYDQSEIIMKEKIVHSWEEEVLSEFDYLANIIKKRLDNRSCSTLDDDNNYPYPILEVLEEMKYLFRNPDTLDNVNEHDEHDTVTPFSGNINDYYNHTNSLINHCLLRSKTGIPITLAIIYVGVVRRVCNVDMNIVGLPGHIVVGVPFNDEDDLESRLFVDPFHEGRILSYTDCQDIVSRYNITFNTDMVRPISNEEVWQRIIRNLIHSHSMQALEDDNSNNDESNHEWKIAIPLRFLLSDYNGRVMNFRDLISSPGWCPQFC